MAKPAWKTMNLRDMFTIGHNALSRRRSRPDAEPLRRRWESIHSTFEPFTMIGKNKYMDTLQLVHDWSGPAGRRGSVVECGCWRGGMIGGIAMVLGAVGDYHLFDSFQGLPPAKAIDGKRALTWQQDTDGEKYYDNCTAAISEAEAAMAKTEVSWHIHPGWFNDTFQKAAIENIALLRLDGDWYDSTRLALETFYPRLQEGGLLLIDDYYIWAGCCRAVHDYLSSSQSTSRLRSNNQVCYLIKTEAVD